MYKVIKASALSLKPKRWDKPYNADKLEHYIRKAAEEEPDLIVAPEGVLEGYVTGEVVENPELGKEMLSIAEPMDGEYVKRFRDLARELNKCLCFGFAERRGGDIYNTSIFIDGNGEILGDYQKTQFAEGYIDDWYFNRIGKKLRAFDTPYGRAGILICNDRWNPMIARTMVLDGAQMLLINSFGSKSKGQNETVLGRARENGVPIVEANVGVNMIVSKGEVVAYKWGNDCITTAEIEIPMNVGRFTEYAREYEKRYLELQGPEMKLRAIETYKELAGGDSSIMDEVRVGKLIL